MGRRALRLLALCVLLSGGLTAAVLSGASRAASLSTSSSTATTTTVATTTTTLTAKSVLVLTGHGYGHGLGLSQWGAYGYAKHGWTYEKILAHYYTGTTLGAAPVSTIRVLLTQAKTVTLSSTVAWTAADAAGHTVALVAGTPLVLTPDLAVNGQALTPPITFSSAQPLTVNHKAYRGNLVVTLAGTKVQVVDSVALESYVKGVVAAEMPYSWSPAALEAQAVATRSYALANRSLTGSFDVYGDVRSQVYGGVAAETPTTTAAVAATSGQVLLYGGKVADTMFFSSSGGRTASAKEVLGVAVPYLVSVADPYDTLSPYHSWGPVLIDLAKVQKLLKLSAPIDDLQVTPSPSGRTQSVTVLSGGEPADTLTGAQLRSVLGLRSTWFTPAVLSLVPPAAPMTYGGAASLTGFVRGAATGVTLEARPVGGIWAPAGDIAPSGDGSFSTIVQPQVSMQYRLAFGSARIGLARVNVAPLVSAQATDDGGITGTVQPLLPGEPVDLQEQSGTTWTTVTSTATDENGTWSFPGLSSAPGMYRVRCAPGNGLAAGLSATVIVQ